MTMYVPRFYVDRDGNPSERQYYVRVALRPLHDLYGNTKGVVEATLPCLPPQLAAMVQLQLHTAMRPDEVTIMRKCDINFAEDVWVYIPHAHKTEHHDHARAVYLGPACQLILKSWLDRSDEVYLFSPREVVTDNLAKRRKRPSKAQAKFQYKNAPREHYDDESYCRAVKRACVRAGVHKWTPNQLRHTAATYIRETYGLEAAKIVLGHQSTITTEISFHRAALRFVGDNPDYQDVVWRLTDKHAIWDIGLLEQRVAWSTEGRAIGFPPLADLRKQYQIPANCDEGKTLIDICLAPFSKLVAPLPILKNDMAGSMIFADHLRSSARLFLDKMGNDLIQTHVLTRV